MRLWERRMPSLPQIRMRCLDEKAAPLSQLCGKFNYVALNAGSPHLRPQVWNLRHIIIIENPTKLKAFYPPSKLVLWGIPY